MAQNIVSTSPSRFPIIQPSLLAPMQVLEVLDTEAAIQARLAKLKEIWAASDPPNAAQFDVGSLEFEPLVIQAEMAEYFEALVRDRVNQATKAITLSFSVGSDLDAIGSRYPYGVTRLTTAAGTWSGPGIAEPDDQYRQRLWMSPSIFSLNGPGQGTYESYVFWAMSAPMPVGQPQLKHAAAFTKPGTGNVVIPILSASPINTTWVQSAVDRREWNLVPGMKPVPSAAQIAEVYDYITDVDFARQGLTDVVSVIAPKVVETSIDVDLYYFPGIDVPTLAAQTNKAVADLIVAISWLGADLTKLSLQGALAQAGMYRSVINSPLDDVTTDTAGVVNVISARLRYMGEGE